MWEKSIGTAGAVAMLTLAACGAVGGTDAEFWKPANGLGTPLPGAGGTVQVGSGGRQESAGGYFTGGAESAGGIQGKGGWQVTGSGGDLGSGGFLGGGGGFVGGSGGVLGTGGTNSATCSFRFDVTTTSYGGRFRPRNVGAIYIENAGGSFVKSLNVWGTVELVNLTDWQQLSGGNKTDAVSGATRANAGPVSGSWDCTDVNHQPVPDGQYQACCSFQEDDALPFFGPAPKKACVTFTKGGPFTVSAPDQGNFTQMTLTLQ